MPPKRQRKPKQPFDQGVNPSSQKRRAPATRQNPTHLTPKRVRRERCRRLQRLPRRAVKARCPSLSCKPPKQLPPRKLKISVEDEESQQDEVNPVLRVRWRACLGGDMEKHFIPEAADSEHGVRLYSLHFDDLWQWAKRERAIKRLRRGVDATWNSFQRLVVEVDNYVSEPVNVDFELILAEIPGEQQPLPTVVDGPPEQAGSGHAIAIRDRWRCTDTHCENYPYCCWMAPTARQPARFEDHLFVNGNIISMWAEQLQREGQPKDLRVHEKTRKLRAAGDGDDDIKSLTKLLIVGQLERMNRQPQQESNLQAAAPTITRAEVSSASQWAPIRYDHEQEINEHTSNFFNYLKLKFPTVGEDINELYKTLVIDGAMDINLLMQPSGDILKLWTQHFKQPPGWFSRYKTLQRMASWKREEIARKKLVVEPSSSVVEDDGENA
ncbi:hypothetical protein A1F94_010339 [Pyrenophora tritici-repentis]|nr:hypothetical protein A1F94_010339 [Pyrenophora tritici-repentis]